MWLSSGGHVEPSRWKQREEGCECAGSPALLAVFLGAWQGVWVLASVSACSVGRCGRDGNSLSCFGRIEKEHSESVCVCCLRSWSHFGGCGGWLDAARWSVCWMVCFGAWFGQVMIPTQVSDRGRLGGSGSVQCAGCWSSLGGSVPAGAQTVWSWQRG